MRGENALCGILKVITRIVATGGGTHTRHLFRSSHPPVTTVRNQLQEHIPLKELATMRVGGPARYFYSAKNIADIAKALSFAKERRAPLFILGGGSNIVISDDGFDGLVLRPDVRGIQYKEHEGSLECMVGAGESWDAFVQKIVSRNIFGIENLSAIPGTVGGAPVQNIGAYGVEVKDFITTVEVFNGKTGEVETMSRDACLFSYRDSMFKQDKGKHLIITRVGFMFEKNKQPNLSYTDVAEHITKRGIKEDTLSPADIRNVIVDIRSQKLPDIAAVGTVGSFFKNPIISKEKFLALSHIYRGLPGHILPNGNVKVPLAWIIEHVVNKKGFVKDGVGVYDKHALVLVNFGGGNAASVRELAEEIRREVKRHTGLAIEFEISFVGKFNLDSRE